MPNHIAIIMDGNGRWAKKRGLPRIAGHHQGVKSVREIVEVCIELGIKYLTLYTFSTENWNRPKDEISALMQLLIATVKKEISELNKNNVKLMTIGNIDKLPPRAKQEIMEGVERTNSNTGLNLILALNYGGREEIVTAIRKIALLIEKKKLEPEEIDQEIFRENLYTSGLPDPDLLIRTSGELRISNFLLWQLAYTEIYITNIMWPEFRRKHLYKALKDYIGRERRFGKVSKQV